MMRADGVNAEIIYPTIASTPGTSGSDGRTRVVRRLQRLDLERLRWHRPLKLAAMIPTWTSNMAIDEVAAHGEGPLGRRLLLPLVGTPEWNCRCGTAWAAIQETGIPADDAPGQRGTTYLLPRWGSPHRDLLTTQSMARARPRC